MDVLPGQSISLSATQQLIPAPLINTIDEILEDGSPFGFIMKGALDLEGGCSLLLDDVAGGSDQRQTRSTAPNTGKILVTCAQGDMHKGRGARLELEWIVPCYPMQQVGA